MGTVVGKRRGTKAPVDQQMCEAGQHRGLQIPFSLALCQVVEVLHQNKIPDLQNQMNMKLQGEIPAHSLKQRILAKEGPLLYLYFPLLKGNQTGLQLQVSKQCRIDFFQNNQVVLHHKAP